MAELEESALGVERSGVLVGDGTTLGFMVRGRVHEASALSLRRSVGELLPYLWRAGWTDGGGGLP